MLRTNTTRNARAAPQQYEEAHAALASIIAMAKLAGERSRPTAEFHPGQGAATLMSSGSGPRLAASSAHRPLWMNSTRLLREPSPCAG
jgi:hypothetical protein